MNIINAIKYVTNLATTNRFSKSHLQNDESVLEHSGFVCLMCYFIGNAINEHQPERINMGKLLSKAIVHDIDEAITADVQRTVKYHNDKTIQIFEEISREATEIISEDICDKNILIHWTESKKGDEGRIVALCDVISVIYKAYDEVVIRSNMGIDFGGVMGLRKIVNNRMKSFILSDFPEEVVGDIHNSCLTLIDEIDERMK